MIWAGSPFAHRIEFSTGLPIGAVSYQLRGNDGTLLISDEAAPISGALSHLIIIDGVHNDCNTPLFENRTLTYYFQTPNGLVSDRVTYRVQRPIPFAVSADGVRAKLGVEPHELADEQIDLLSAYAEFTNLVAGFDLTDAIAGGDRTTLLCIHAIEALAGLQWIGALQIKIAQRESSGTNEYQRYSKVDWSALEASLAAHVDRARAEIDPLFDATGGTVFSFGTVTRTDAITGE